jgi:hypothetical protein
MSIEMLIYLIGALDGISAFLGIVGIAFGMGALLAAMLWSVDENKEAKPWIARCLILGALTFMVFVAVPSSKTATLMAAASIGKDAIASETGQKLKKVLDAKLDSLVSEIEKKAK